jgi:3-methyladenine DNA glycosylase/8-oxoguanine DNA glycosylase
MIPARRLREAEQHLRERDPRLARLIESHGPCTLGRRRRDPFQVLCASIVSQQLSARAADAIMQRLIRLAGIDEALTPAGLLDQSHEALRACGLSNAKARWLRALAEATRSGELDFRRLRRLDDEAAITRLDALPGVGRWTAEMVLIFALDRLDVFALGDIGLRRALERSHNHGQPLDEARVRTLSGAWTPFRSVASWYLWRLTDGDVGSWS